MDMTMQHQLGMVAIQQLMKDGEAAVGQVVQVAVAVHRRVGDKDVKPAVAVDLAPQAVDALAHLGLGKLPGTGAVAAGPAQPHNAQPVVDEQVVIQADGTLGRVVVVVFVMIAVHVQNRHGDHGGKILKIVAVQIATGYNEVYALDLIGSIVIPKRLALLIGNAQQLHSVASFSAGSWSRWIPCMRYIGRACSVRSSYSGMVPSTASHR